jgi:murein DD-endopeptidase MepM/ murein hydrolase activator NlpD
MPAAPASWRVVACLGLLGALSACGAGTPPPSASTAEPAARDILLPIDSHRVEGLVPSGLTLDTLLRGHGVADDAAERVIAAARGVFDPRRLRSLQPFSIERSLQGALRVFEYEIDGDRLLRIVPADLGSVALSASVVPIPKTLERGVSSGTIDADTPSLFQSIDAAGERPELAIALAGVFAGEIDFNTELQPGDQYTLAFERFRRDGRPTTYGAITAAEFRNDGRVLRAIRFTVPGEAPGYYDEQGRSLRRFFLRSPLKFEPRVTSGFSASRRHPVLHTARAHRGIDYAAPTGAPVVAAASGTVLSAGYDPSNGRMVRMRHASGYESYYLHLSAFAPGLRTGDRIEQGEVIGRVGSSGLSTGPHLHYGLTKNGAFVNPLVEQRNLPPGEPVPESALPAFHAERALQLAQLEAASRQAAD